MSRMGVVQAQEKRMQIKIIIRVSMQIENNVVWRETLICKREWFLFDAFASWGKTQFLIIMVEVPLHSLTNFCNFAKITLYSLISKNLIKWEHRLWRRI